MAECRPVVIRPRWSQFHYKAASSALPSNANTGSLSKDFVQNDEVRLWMSRTPTNDRKFGISRLSTRVEEGDTVRSTVMVRKTQDARVPTKNTFQNLEAPLRSEIAAGCSKTFSFQPLERSSL